jgi:hypothetical protein
VIPKGIGWQSLRSLALDAVPRGSSAYHVTSMPLNQWRRHGAFTVTSCTKAEILIEASGVEIGTALLSDTEHLLDHAAEHQVQLYQLVVGNSWHSPAWAVVTTYYWAFFSVLGITRLCGRSAWFLDKSALTELRKLGGSLVHPGGGALYFSVDRYLSETVRTMTLRPSKRQFHDAVWTCIKRIIGEVFAACDEETNSLEYRLWNALEKSANRFGPDWPSKLRNAVNYIPGCGYREVISRSEIDVVRHMRQRTPTTIEALIGHLEDALVEISPNGCPEHDIKLFSRLLALVAIVLARIAHSLQDEILDRQGGDQRWRTLRTRFFNQRCANLDSTVWPLSE